MNKGKTYVKNSPVLINASSILYEGGGKTLDKLFDLVYPVGSIYLSVSSINPKDLFGGTWMQIECRFLLGVGSTTDDAGDTRFYGLGATGGEFAHTLNTDQIPSHYHWGIYGANGSAKRMAGWGETTTHTGTLYEHGLTAWEDLQTGYTGGGQSHNNMPPYLAVYIWKRTA